MTETTWPARMDGKLATDYLEKEHGITLTYQTLAKYRQLGCGPEYEMKGRYIRYPRAALDDWAEERTIGRVRSVAEARRLMERSAAA